MTAAATATLSPEQGADAARRAASAILSERRFHPPAVPRPLHGPLHAIGSALKSAADAVVNAVAQLGRSFPGGALALWILLGVALVALTLWLAGRHSKRLLLEPPARGEGIDAKTERPEALERAAARAEREGRLAQAVRLRFRAGLLRLAEKGAIPTARSTPTAEVAHALRSPEFDSLASRFDEIAYGGALAEPEDAERARSGWPVVLREAQRA